MTIQGLTKAMLQVVFEEAGLEYNNRRLTTYSTGIVEDVADRFGMVIDEDTPMNHQIVRAITEEVERVHQELA